MPRYHFNVHDGRSIPDREGVELASLEAARGTAIVHASELLKDDPALFWSGEEWKMEVTDERGLILFTLIFSAYDSPAVGVRPKPPPAR